MEKIEIYSSRKKALLLLIGSLLFVTGGTYMLLSPETFTGRDPHVLMIVGIAAILFFGLGIYVSIRQLIANQLILIIDNMGINVNPRKSLSKIIEWKNIEGFSEIEIYSTKIVVIHVNNPKDWIEKEENKIRKKMMNFNVTNYGSPFNLSANSMQINHATLMKVLNENLQKYRT